MRQAISTLVLAASVTVTAWAQRPAETAVVFDGVTVLDVEQGTLVPHQRVVIVGTRIQAIGASRGVKVPKGARVVDATNKYLIPGLWDMHTHMWGYPNVFFPLLIANGVTGIRDMHGKFLDSMRLWRQEVAAGTRVGPRMLLTAGWVGPNFEDGTWGGWSSQIPLTAVEQANALVDSLKTAGADHIKIRGGLSRELHFALSAAARRAGMPLVGHPTGGVTFAEASDSGQRSLEHGHPWYPCNPSETTDEQCAALAARFVRNGTWVTPTIVAQLYWVGGVEPDRLRFWPTAADVGDSAYREITGGIRASLAKDQWLQQVDQDNLSILGMLRRAGMPILAGSDAAQVMLENTPGFSLLDELAIFVRGGLTPLEALRTATLNPAKYLQATDSLGTVAAGKLADLVLLDVNPLVDVPTTTTIRAVVANGRYFDRAKLDTLIAEVERRGRGKADAPVP